MAEVTRCHHPETGGEAELPTDVLGVYAALGWEPITGVSRSRDEAEAERARAEDEAAAPTPAPPVEAEPAAPTPELRTAPVARPTSTAGHAGTKEN